MLTIENAATAARAIFFWLAAALMVVVISAIVGLYPEIRDELVDAHRVTLSVGGTAAEIRASAKQWEMASRQSQELTAQSIQILKNLNVATSNLNATTVSLTAMIQHTDNSVNVLLVPELTRTIGANDARLSQVVTNTNNTLLAIAETSRSASEAMAEATKTLAAAGKVIGDPSIPATLGNTETASKNVASTTGHIDAASADIQAKVHQMTRPASFAKRFAEATLTLAAPVVSIFK